MQPIPSHICGYPVIAFLRLPSLSGELPDHGIAIGDDSANRPTYPYVVWKVEHRGGTWGAGSGTWGLTWVEAVEEFTARATQETYRAGGRGPAEPAPDNDDNA